MEHTIDATGGSLGRVATQAAVFLMGKDTPAYKKNIVSSVKVTIVNASKANIDQKKKSGKIYTRYSGHPGGLKHTTMEKVIEKKGYSEVFKNAIYGMLPANKLRKEMMKNLTVTE